MFRCGFHASQKPWPLASITYKVSNLRFKPSTSMMQEPCNTAVDIMTASGSTHAITMAGVEYASQSPLNITAQEDSTTLVSRERADLEMPFSVSVPPPQNCKYCSQDGKPHQAASHSYGYFPAFKVCGPGWHWNCSRVYAFAHAVGRYMSTKHYDLLLQDGPFRSCIITNYAGRVKV